jgi:hypothetical protein
VKQEQVQVPTIVLLVHTVKPPSFCQRQEDAVPQKPLPKSNQNQLMKQNNMKGGIATGINLIHTLICSSEGKLCKQ